MICEVLPKTLPCILAGRSPPATNALTRTPPSNGELFPPCGKQPAWARHLLRGTFVFLVHRLLVGCHVWFQTASSSLVVHGGAWGFWRIVTHAVGVVGGRAAVRVGLDRRRVLRPPVHRPAIVLCTTSSLVRESHKQRKLRSANCCWSVSRNVCRIRIRKCPCWLVRTPERTKRVFSHIPSLSLSAAVILPT